MTATVGSMGILLRCVYYISYDSTEMYVKNAEKDTITFTVVLGGYYMLKYIVNFFRAERRCKHEYDWYNMRYGGGT